MKPVTVVDTLTGEVQEFAAGNAAEIAEAYRQVDAQLKALDRAKKKLRDRIIDLDLDGQEVGNYRFKISSIQRQTYDKAVLRRVFDEDMLDLFLVPDKTAVDNYLKENLESLGDDSTVLRQAMVDIGRPYQTVRLEKLKKD